MSIATSKKDSGYSRETISPAPGAERFVEKTAKKIKQDFFGAAAFFAVVVSGIGFLFGRQLNIYWCVLTLALVAAVFYEKFFPPIVITGEEKKIHVNIPLNKDKN